MSRGSGVGTQAWAVARIATAGASALTAVIGDRTVRTQCPELGPSDRVFHCRVARGRVRSRSRRAAVRLVPAAVGRVVGEPDPTRERAAARVGADGEGHGSVCPSADEVPQHDHRSQAGVRKLQIPVVEQAKPRKIANQRRQRPRGTEQLVSRTTFLGPRASGQPGASPSVFSGTPPEPVEAPGWFRAACTGRCGTTSTASWATDVFLKCGCRWCLGHRRFAVRSRSSSH